MLTPAYPYLRKPNGSLYQSGSPQPVTRSLKGALSANGLFELARAQNGRKRVEVWRVKEAEAREYVRQEMVKFAHTKAKLSQRGRKLACTDDQIRGFVAPEPKEAAGDEEVGGQEEEEEDVLMEHYDMGRLQKMR